jgi:hypothetical protein
MTLKTIRWRGCRCRRLPLVDAADVGRGHAVDRAYGVAAVRSVGEGHGVGDAVDGVRGLVAVGVMIRRQMRQLRLANV